MTKQLADKDQLIWTKVWSRDYSSDENRIDIEREQSSVRWKKLKRLILKQFGSLTGLKTVEIGAGRGIYSLLASLEGSEAHLLDQNELALEKAKELFGAWDQSFQSICADAFELPDELRGTFDIAMSYGFAEHFRNPERMTVFKSHLALLKPGGLLIVSVPNAAFVPYRAGKFLLERLNKWEFGLEIPFWRKELKTIADQLELKHPKIVGSGVVSDALNFWLVQRLFHLPGYLVDVVRAKLNPNQKIIPLKNRFSYFSGNPETKLDDYLGYALVLVGEKS